MSMELQAIAFKDGRKRPMLEINKAFISTQSGVEHDIFGKPGPRQVTVLSRQQWLDTCNELGTSISWLARRANLLIDGVRFGADSVGQFLKIGNVILEITGETNPCKNMEQEYPGLEAALVTDWRGGVTCRVIREGNVTKGNAVIISDQPE
ncbi:molybdenum cofactor biosysynthesis protein [Shewanella yunxiaonensis]|uniref:Molybdenum cofactor biosysynthesis protein n=2 Tax=Shewanella yunxiaonensis TaxID=2829809 RepID=A0ABX7YUC4_9GAMM|nr:molybdenum cofactor biosysynthesis protein [Shewanella yunxiaonensis]